MPSGGRALRPDRHGLDDESAEGGRQRSPGAGHGPTLAGGRGALGPARVTIGGPCDASRRRSSPLILAVALVPLLALAVFGGPAATPGVVPSGERASPPGRRRPSRGSPSAAARAVRSRRTAPDRRRGPVAERAQRSSHDRRLRAGRRLPVHGDRRRRRRHHGRPRRHGQALDHDRARRLGCRGHRRRPRRPAASPARSTRREGRPCGRPDRPGQGPGQGLEAHRLPARLAGDARRCAPSAGAATSLFGVDRVRTAAAWKLNATLAGDAQPFDPGGDVDDRRRAATSSSTGASTSRSRSWARAPTSRSTAGPPGSSAGTAARRSAGRCPTAKRTGNAGRRPPSADGRRHRGRQLREPRPERAPLPHRRARSSPPTRD